jgi:hypothetical protein
VYSGRLRAAEEVLVQVFEAAHERRMWIEAFEATRALAEVSLLRSDVSEARKWSTYASKWVEQSDEELLRSGSFGLAAAVALWGGDLDEAEGLIIRAGSYFNAPRDGRPRARFLSLKLAVEVQLHQRVSREEEDELRALLSRCLSLGGHDLGVVTLARILSLRGDVESRANLLSAYRSARRERYVVPTYLSKTFLENSAALS